MGDWKVRLPTELLGRRRQKVRRGQMENGGFGKTWYMMLAQKARGNGKRLGQKCGRHIPMEQHEQWYVVAIQESKSRSGRAHGWKRARHEENQRSRKDPCGTEG